MPVLKNRAYVVTATTGTGTITLGSPVAGYQSFTDAGLTTGAVTRYTIQDGANWEIGLGTYTTSGNTLTRTPSESSNSGAAINLSGNAEVFIAATAEDVSPLYDANFVTQTTSSFLGPNASGTDAVAIGLDAEASGTRSVSIGTLATGTNVGATAAGNGAVALGGSNASGLEAFSANNSRNDATFGSTGANSVTLGYQSRAQATYSVAIGYAAIAGGQYGIALGFTRANGDQSFSIGQNASTASGENTIVIGKAISSSVNNEIAIGGTGNTIKLFDAYTLPTTDGAAGTALVTNGSGALSFSSVGADLYAANPVNATDPVVNGDNSIAIGSAAVAGSVSGNNDKIAIGTGATAGNNQSVLALGYYAAAGASGQSATAVGALAVASGPHSTAIGSGTDATATSAIALGYNAQAVGVSEAVAIGNSRAGGAGSFAAVITNNTSSYGATGANSITIGKLSKTTSASALAIGQANTTSGLQALTLGYTNQATGAASAAIGYTNNATSVNGYAYAFGLLNTVSSSNGGGAFGATNTVSGNNGYAIGVGNTVSHENSVAIGSGISSSATNQINLGHTDETVRISSAYTLPLADGSAGTALVTNGSGALSFSAIGTTTTTAGESATTRYIPFVDSSTGTSDETVRVDPALSFVNNSAAFTGDHKLTVGQGSGSVPVTIMLDGNNNGGNYTPELLFKDGDTAVGSAQKMGRITFQSADTSANGFARIEAAVQTATNPDGSVLVFSTQATGGTYAERLRITETGALQIGTAYTLPTSDGAAGTALVTDGSGALSFSSVGADLYAANPSSATDPTASGTNAVAIGDSAVSSAVASIAIGGDTDATANYNVALGFGAQAVTGASAIALGKSRAGAASSIAGAINNSTSSYGTTGVNSVALGTQSKATNNSAVSIGQSSIGSGYQSAAYGYNAVASGQDSFAGGPTTDATATNSTALGKNAQATHANATAVGYNAATSTTNQVALGASGYAVRVSGAYTLPTSDGAAGTALVTDGSGALSFSAVGADLYAANEVNVTAQPSATGDDAIAIGDSAVASGADAAAFGQYATSAGTRSVAIGHSYASGTDSFAAGISSTTNSFGATGNYSVAIGYRAKTTATDSLAIGQNALASGSRSTAISKSYASGNDSFAAIITNNTSSYGATGTNSVAMGYQAKATSSDAVAIGSATQATASSGVAIGGYSVASATFTVALGHYSKAATQGKFAFSSNRYAAAGDTQGGLYVLRQQTTTATPIALTTSSGGTPTSTQIILPSGSAYAFTGTIVAKQSGSANAAAWEVKGLIVNQGGTTTLTNSATTVISNTPSWGMALSADDTNDALAITVTGASSTTIRWVANIQTSEVSIA